jgi:hypothetical protein
LVWGVLGAFGKIQSRLSALLGAQLSPLLNTGMELGLLVDGQAGKIFGDGLPFALLGGADGGPMGFEWGQGLLL